MIDSLLEIVQYLEEQARLRSPENDEKGILEYYAKKILEAAEEE